ncbi:glyoxylate/hydroxypyruvate reductase A [Acinetobacter suaedae]|uniref:Glyoxylate/hydroxypyruvate reductase A n=1 Tax=Acinetobacter suaedae TaxID=2609668 RepID=A0A5P1URT7_9GAMM|nr:glyoxylate/hydroxypyruvate reductase A [Acinetobacter sp. C16S1]QER39631.1 glyoxylate/hydroxypyruvate reductase A [Acinetobacter sp. C16S1]
MIVIATTVPKVQKWLEDAFAKYAPEDSYCLAQSEAAQYATTAVSWFPDLDYLETLPQLKLIHSMAAGVEHLNLKRIGHRYQVCRVVDQLHQQGMFDYLQWGVLYYQRFFDQAFEQKKQQRWRQYPQRSTTEIKIGIMGLGQMGGYISQRFAALGYQVSGWSRSLKTLENVQCFAGDSDFGAFLSQAEILINLLPLTESNQGILSQDLFGQLPERACVINCGRGQHLVEQDLIDCLDSGRLRGAILDVFNHEPLAIDSALWQHDKILVTPHVASHAPWSIVVEQILENDRRVREGQNLLNLVDPSKGY